MLHSGILPHHPRWAKLFENLRYVVIDELHAYRGVLRQPPRQHPAPAAAYLPPLRVQSDLHLLLGDDREPERAGAGLTEPPFELVTDMARRRGRSSSCSNPPVVTQPGIRRSTCMRRVASRSNFSSRSSRRSSLRRAACVEILLTYLNEAFGRPGDRADSRVSRRALLPNAAVRSSAACAKHRGVVSTNALELGIDIGALGRRGDGGLSGDDRVNLAARRQGARAPARLPCS